jgi:hypothetical protein
LSNIGARSTSVIGYRRASAAHVPGLPRSAAVSLASSRVTDVDQLDGLVDEFANGAGSMVLDVKVSRNVVSRPYRRSYFGIG